MGAQGCLDIDECARDNGGCDTSPLATCQNHEAAAPSCSCPGGYTGDGVGESGCVDIDECATNNGGCDTSPMAACQNRAGVAPSCTCPSGSSGNGVGTNGCVQSLSIGQCGELTCDAETVRDPSNGLSWQRILPMTYDGCEGRYASYQGAPGDACNWDEAKRYCAQLMLLGTGWRLPTREELLSIVDISHQNPAIDVEAFPDTPSHNFWSSSARADISGNAWYVDFRNGSELSSDASLTIRVRCVR